MGMGQFILSTGVAFMMIQTLAAAPAIPPSIIPAPRELKVAEGESFTLKPGQTVLVLEGSGSTDAKPSAERLAKQLGLKIATKAVDGQTILLRTAGKTTPELAYPNPKGEAYTLSVKPEGVVLEAKTPRGMALAVQTLLQLCPPSVFKSPSEVNLPSVEIADEPAYGYRGMHFDVCRHFFTMDEVKKFIDVMSLHKLNTFHWHLTDDQGWRIEIKAYPELTKKGAVRRESPLPGDRTKGDGKPYGPYFFTQKQAKEIIAYAAERQIEVIPEIELPGHAQAALSAYPYLGCTGEAYEPWTHWGVSDKVFCAGNPQTLNFLKSVLNEITQVFPSQYIHIGGDECPKDFWKKCPKCQGLMKANGIRHEEGLQSWFVTQIGKYLESKNKQMIGWDEILEGGIPPGAVIMSWRGASGGIHAAKAKHQVIMTPNSHLYFDYAQSRLPGEPESIGGFVPLKKVYELDVRFGMNEEDASYVLGGQANLWSEYFFDADAMFYHALPRMAALSEAVWNPKKDFKRFKKALNYNMLRYDYLGVNFRFMPVELPTRINFPDSTLLDFGKLPDGITAAYKLNNSEWIAYSEPVKITETTKVTYRTELASGRKSREAVCDFVKREPVAPVYTDSEIEGLSRGKGLYSTVYQGRFQSCGEISQKGKRIGSGVVKNFSILRKEAPQNGYGITWEGYLWVPENNAEYTFTAKSDDGFILYLNGIRVLDNDGLHGVDPAQTGSVFLGRGWHQFEAEWFDAEGAKALELELTVNGKPKALNRCKFAH